MNSSPYNVGDIVLLNRERFQVLEVIEGFLKLQSLVDPEKIWTVRAVDVEPAEEEGESSSSP